MFRKNLCEIEIANCEIAAAYFTSSGKILSGPLACMGEHDSALRALSSLRGLRGAPVGPPLCRETQSLGQQMLNATVGINGLMYTQRLQSVKVHTWNYRSRSLFNYFILYI